MKREREPSQQDERRSAYNGEEDRTNKRARPAYENANSRGPRNDFRNRGDERRSATSDVTATSGAPVVVRTLKTEREDDSHRLAQRQKQIDYGKNTLGYDRYCAMVPRHKRIKGEHPMTPDRTLKVSKKHFDSMVRRWRQALHEYDPPELKEKLQATEENDSPAASAPDAQVCSRSDVAAQPDDADLDPELVELDPSKHQPSSGPSIYDTFHDDDETAAGDANFGDDDDDDLL